MFILKFQFIFLRNFFPRFSNYALKRSFKDCEERQQKQVAKNWKRRGHADDLLRSAPGMPIAKLLIPEAIEICVESGFKLTKFISNRNDLLKLIPDYRRNDVKNQDLPNGELQVDRALGIQ